MSKSKTQIAKARAGLIFSQPFFASLLLPMPISEDSNTATFATDGDSIVYNPAWADKLTLQETTFVLAHETLHCVFDHMGRRGNRTPNRYNQAADYIINQILVDEKIGTMPKGCLLDAALVAKGETAEGVYKLLPESSEQNKPGSSGGSLDSVKDAGSELGTKPVDAATQKQKSAEMKVKIIQAKNAAKMQGKLSAGIARLVEDLTRPVVDWKAVLRRFISERAKLEYSYARPKRRFLSQDLYLPSLAGEKLGSIAVAVDCSGSIDKILLEKFASEINAIREDTLPSKIEIIYFDSQICGTQVFEADQEVKLTPHGGGGTRFSPVFKYLNSLPELPVATIFLTDLECSDFGPSPEFPVLWAVLGKLAPDLAKVPFGEVLEIVDNE